MATTILIRRIGARVTILIWSMAYNDSDTAYGGAYDGTDVT